MKSRGLRFNLPDDGGEDTVISDGYTESLPYFAV